MTNLVVDTSAIVAIFRSEPGYEWIEQQLADADHKVMCAPNALELGIVLESLSPNTPEPARRALQQARITVEAFDAALAERATAAWRRFGKGRHPAALNFGDCGTYALADQLGWPILCAGNDFAQTDVPVLTPETQ